MFVTKAAILASPHVSETYAVLEPKQYRIDLRFTAPCQRKPVPHIRSLPNCTILAPRYASHGVRIMPSPSYDIFKRDAAGEVWVEAVRDLETAKGRLIELAAEAPGQYVIFSQRSGRLVSSGTVVASPAARATTKETEKPAVDCAASKVGGSDTLW